MSAADLGVLLLQQPLQFPGAHSALAPVGPQAERIHALWQFMWIVSVVVWVAVVLAALYATFHRRSPAVVVAPDEEPLGGGGPGMRNAVVGATAVTILILFIFLVVDFRTGRALTLAPAGALQINVTGH